MTHYDPEQQQTIALANRRSSRSSRRARLALLEALAVEAGFRNPSYGDRDSEGGLQQRPSQGWGPASEDLGTDMDQFLAAARRLEARGFRGSPGQLAQAVQRSAFPGRYDEHAGEAARLLASGGPVTTTASLGRRPGLDIADGASPPGGASSLTGLRRSLALSLLGKSPERPLELLQAIGDARRAGPTAPVPTTTPTTGTSRAAHHGAPGYGGLDEIIYHAPGHEDHLHVGEGQDPALMLRVIDEAQRLGLSVRENPYTDPVDPVHVKGSFHYRRFPGRYRGRRLGEGADISGNPRKLEQLYRELGGRTRY